MELLFYASAFVCGFVVLQFKLPPLIGFLCAGFILNMAGYQSTNLLETMAELGVTLLLFSIGLKLKIGNLTKAQVWGPATIHIVVCSLIFWAVLIALSHFKWSLFTQLSVSSAAILAFALSFSSTVFAVKVLEERGEMTSLHAKVAIGILVIQDIFAVVFLAVSTGKIPNLWAIALLAALPFIRPVFYWMLSRSKHGEVLPLFGFFFALVVGYHAFEFAGLKATWVL